MIKEFRRILLFDTIEKYRENDLVREGAYEKWMRHQKSMRVEGHTLITTYNINYQFVTKSMNGLFYPGHECTILRAVIPQTDAEEELEPVTNINIYPFRLNRRSHAKLLISINGNGEYFIAIGSANITFGGLGGSNLEFLGVFSSLKDIRKQYPGISYISKPMKKSLSNYLDGNIIKKEVGNITTVKRNIQNISHWLQKSMATGLWPNIIDNTGQPLLDQIMAGKGKIDSVEIMSPYHGISINLFGKYCKRPPWIIGYDQKVTKNTSRNYEFYYVKSSDKSLHAKAFIITARGNHWLYYGSANCSRKALQRTTKQNAGQWELMLGSRLNNKDYKNFLKKYRNREPIKPDIAAKKEFMIEEPNPNLLLCINLDHFRRKILLMTAKRPTMTLSITLDKTTNTYYKFERHYLNKWISFDALPPHKRGVLSNKSLSKWAYQKLDGKLITVPINHEGCMTYEQNAVTIEDELLSICSNAKVGANGGNKKRRGTGDEYSSLSHESELDIWYKKIRTIRKADKDDKYIKELYLQNKKRKLQETHKLRFLKNIITGN